VASRAVGRIRSAGLVAREPTPSASTARAGACAASRRVSSAKLALDTLMAQLGESERRRPSLALAAFVVGLLRKALSSRDTASANSRSGPNSVVATRTIVGELLPRRDSGMWSTPSHA